MNQAHHSKQLFNNDEAAAYVGFKPRTLNNSRYTGVLGGVPAPKYKKLGKAVRYTKQSLDLWLGQFQDQANTSEPPHSKA